MEISQTDTEILKSRVQCTTPREERSRPKGILKKKSMNTSTFEATLLASIAYSTASTYLDTRMNGLVHTSSTDSSLESMELVAQSVVKLLRPKRIRLTIDSWPTQSSQDLRDLTPLISVHDFSPPNQTIYNTLPHHNKSLRRVSTTTNIYPHPTIIFFSINEIDNTKSVCAGPRPVGATEASKEDDKSRKVYGNVANNSIHQDDHVNKQAPKGEYLCLI